MGTFTGGLGSQMMLAAETEYGTIVIPNRSFEYSQGETMKLARPKLASQQLAAGRGFQSSGRTVATTRAAAGTVPLEVPNQGFGALLNLLHGETVVPAKEGAVSVYKQVHNIGTTDPSKKSVTLQLGKPTIAGVVNPFTYPGTTLISMDLACQVNGWLMATLNLDSKDEQTGTALATFSPPTNLESFPFTKCVISVNGVEQKFARSVTMKLDTPKDVARYFLGATTKQQPLTNAYNASSGVITIDYADAVLYKLFEEAKTVPIEISWIGATVEAIVTELKLTMAACKLEGDSPTVQNLGPLPQTIGFKVEDNRTNPPIVATYISKDATL